MKQDTVRDFETLHDLSARLNVPGCMLLRANRLYSAAWLLPGRVIDVPEGNFCLADEFECPVRALNHAATRAE